jgi:CubicO group peptidase (beta-lactamase class C family)
MNTTTSILVILFLNLSLFTCEQSQDKSETSTKTDKINELVSLYAEYGMFNGAVLVVDNGDILYEKAFGLANMEWDIPNTTDTKFKIASITKEFTAMLIMQLVAENKLDLNTSISAYLPDFPKENGDRITIHHLLSHSAGLGRDASDQETYNQPKDMVNQFAHAPLKFVPGEGFEYSNSGYTLLGYIIETITEQSYEVALQERIFEPLKMTNSGFFRNQPLIKNMAAGYNKGFGEYFNTEDSNASTAYAAGAIYSTVEDMLLWDQALNTDILLPKRYRDLFFEKHSVDTDEGGYYGYGWELKTKPIGNASENVETVGHSGRINGFRTLYTKIPSRDAVIIILNNTSHAFLNSMTTAITGILYNQPYNLPLIPLAQFMVKTIEEEGIDPGIAYYKEHKDASGYYASEQELIVAGYNYLQAGNAKDAAKIFRLAIEMFPDRYNTYDSYAEALMTLGKNTEAIINYKKSLELNPKNTNAIDMLGKLGINYSTDLLKTEDTWGKELFAIPLHFAEDIKLKGYEDARFPKGWKDTESSDFWTYVFAWKVNVNNPLTEIQVEAYITKYYDGLLASVNKEKDLDLPKTTVSIAKNSKGHFIGSASIYDTFTTRQPLVLNFNIQQVFCDSNGKSIIVFRISPKAFGHSVWNDLMNISLVENSCD